jgi:hypothetical protein
MKQPYNPTDVLFLNVGVNLKHRADEFGIMYLNLGRTRTVLLNIRLVVLT